MNLPNFTFCRSISGKPVVLIHFLLLFTEQRILLDNLFLKRGRFIELMLLGAGKSGSLVLASGWCLVGAFTLHCSLMEGIHDESAIVAERAWFIAKPVCLIIHQSMNGTPRNKITTQRPRLWTTCSIYEVLGAHSNHTSNTPQTTADGGTGRMRCDKNR